MPSFTYGEMVTVVSRALTGQDDYGNDVYGTTETPYYNVPAWPTGSSEKDQAADLVITGVTVLLPAGTVVTPTDRVLVYGNTYEVDGEPAQFSSPFTNTGIGVETRLKRVTG